LGAFGSDLAALACFFDPPWERPVACLTADQVYFLCQAGSYLRALGRLQEAVAPMRTAVDMSLAIESWIGAALGAGNLSELQLTLGEVREAIALAEPSVGYADLCGDAFKRLYNRTTLADVWHQAGDGARAEELFKEAEQLQAKQVAGYPRLYSFQGHRYCDLLLDLGRHAEVRDRATHAIAIAQRNKWLLDIALDNLSLGGPRFWPMRPTGAAISPGPKPI
jgi:tetratricopeptide (TPR) repeat protein